jgi:hypothetical protein
MTFPGDITQIMTMEPGLSLTLPDTAGTMASLCRKKAIKKASHLKFSS